MQVTLNSASCFYTFASLPTPCFQGGIDKAAIFSYVSDIQVNKINKNSDIFKGITDIRFLLKIYWFCARESLFCHIIPLLFSIFFEDKIWLQIL